MGKYTGLEIAIIGMSGKFPGAENVNEFWQNIKSGKESVEFFTNEELMEAGESPEMINNESYVNAGSYVKNKEHFDAGFFDYIPDEAKLMDPQMRIFHECVWEALEDAGCDLKNNKDKVGLFAGAANNTNWVVYSELVNQQGFVDPVTLSKLNDARYIATRVSYNLDLKGPSIFIDTACSTSLVAIEQASKSLILGDCKVAVAGGVTITNKANQGYLHQEGAIFSADGHCRTFDSKASGTIGSEGAAVVVLKMLKHAITDGDNIYAIIRGGGINNDGKRKVGFTAPSVDGQVEAIMAAQKWSKIEPSSISYVEAHGTGTKMGDPVEIAGLKRAFGNSDEKYCGIGSLKSNVGHMDTAAGAASVIKVANALNEKILPPTINFDELNPEIDFSGTPFYINTELKKWENNGTPLRAGVSAFGIGGTNAHLVLEEPPVQDSDKTARDSETLVFSAKTQAALQRNLEKYALWFENQKSYSLADVAYTLKTGRTDFSCRKAITVTKGEDIAEKIRKEIQIPAISNDALSNRQVVFMFSGQGSQYVNMSKGMYENDPKFKTYLDECLQELQKQSGVQYKEILFGSNADKITETQFTQPLLFAVEYSLCKRMIDLGIRPDAMIGHSIGEYVAACVSGVFTMEEAIRIVLQRGKLMQSAPKGDMLAVSLSESEVQKFIVDKAELSLAAVNSTNSCVVAGSSSAIGSLKASLEEKDIKSVALKTSHAFHSYMMNGIRESFKASFQGISAKELSTPYVSNVTGDWIKQSEVADPEYWFKHLRGTVQFEKGINTILDKGNAVFIEIGPGVGLSSLVKSNERRDEKSAVINTMRHPKEETQDDFKFQSAIGQIWSNGIEINWKEGYQDEKRLKVSLPTYCFEKVAYPVCVDANKLLADLLDGKQIDLSLESTQVNNNDTSEVGSTSSLVEQVKSTWQEFFGKNVGNDHADFFDLGGDSLKATTLIGRMNKRFNVNIQISEFNNASTPYRIADLIQEKKESGEVQSTIEKAEGHLEFPLSSAQKRVFVMSEMDKKSIAYNLPHFIKIKGNLDTDKLQSAFESLLNQHPVLQTGFKIANSEPVQFQRNDIAFQLEVQGNVQESEAISKTQQFIQPFNLLEDTLIRGGVLQLPNNESVLMMDVHHIISDGVSQSWIVSDLLKAYAGETFEEQSLNYFDYSLWEQGNEYAGIIEKSKAFWMKEFEKEVAELELPQDFNRPAIKSFEGKSVPFQLDTQTTDALKMIARQQNTTMFTVLLGVYNVFLSKLTGEKDIIVGTAASGRVHADVEQMIGMFVNTLPIRSDVDSKVSFAAYLSGLHNKVLQCFDNQAFPYNQLVEELRLKRRQDRNPLFETFFAFQNIENVTASVNDLQVIPFEIEVNMAQFDMQLWVSESPEGMSCRFDYATSLFTESTVVEFAQFFKNLIQAVASDVNESLDKTSLLTQPQQEEILSRFTNNTSDLSQDGKSVVEIFEATAEEFPERVACVFGTEELTYSQLNNQANQLARAILSSGVENGNKVGICMSRSMDMMVSILAVLKAGCTYLPMDPGYPKERVQHIVEDSSLMVILTDENGAPLVEDGAAKSVQVNTIETEALESSNLGVSISDDQLAYMIYTSGSTGKPKGVMITHRNVVNFCGGVKVKTEFNNEARFLCLTTVAFDIFVLESLVPLMSGNTVVLANEEEQKDMNLLISLVQQTKLDTIQMTPSHLKMLLGTPGVENVLNQIKTLMIGGEEFPVALARETAERYSGRLFNMYGPTETTVWSSIKEIKKNEAVTIGSPINNTELLVLDESGNILPEGVMGELCIGGEGVSKGYWNKEELTKERFISHPVHSDRKIYRTGDNARLLKNGEVQFLGRTDTQVKVRGFRIELGEIEQHLSNVNGIESCAAAVRVLDEEKVLVAYITGDVNLSSGELRNYLMSKIPSYMVPDFIMTLEEMPLTPNGKLDRKALPNPKMQVAEDFKAPSNSTEIALQRIWSEILNIDLEFIGVNTNFFELGGQSLKAAVMINRINADFKTDLSLTDVFSKQTIEELSDFLITLLQLQEESMEENDDLIEISL